MVDLTLTDTTICGNTPDDIDGSFIDGGGNDLCTCPADYNGYSVITGADLGVWLLFTGGDNTPSEPCPGDLAGDGLVGGNDRGVLLLS